MNRATALRNALPLAALLLGLRASADAPKETWTGMYLNGKKIGYTSIVSETSTWAGKSAVKLTSHSVSKIEVFGNSVSQDITSTSFNDTSFAPLHQEYVIRSGGSSTTLIADYKPGRIDCKIDTGGGASTKTIEVPKGARLIGDSSTAGQGKPLAVGAKESYYFLEPMTQALQRLDIEVLSSSTVTLSGKSYSALKMREITPMGQMVSWETLEGDLLKSDMALGPLSIVVLREDKAAAMNLAAAMPAFKETGVAAAATDYRPTDLATATAVAVAHPIAKPREARSLSATLSGVKDHLITDGRQQITPASAGAYKLAVKAGSFDPARAATLPITAAAAQPYLGRAAYLEIDDPKIRAIAAEVKGKETNSYRVAAAIRKWVHATMKPDYTIGVPRSCVTLSKDPRGVCRDYATLFAGIARAAGIPTRLCGGIVYAEGKFFYHAWVECWLGDWVAFDPTLPSDFVDATHVKFSQGDVTEMYAIGSVIGQIKLDDVKAE